MTSERQPPAPCGRRRTPLRRRVRPGRATLAARVSSAISGVLATIYSLTFAASVNRFVKTFFTFGAPVFGIEPIDCRKFSVVGQADGSDQPTGWPLTGLLVLQARGEDLALDRDLLGVDDLRLTLHGRS